MNLPTLRRFVVASLLLFAAPAYAQAPPAPAPPRPAAPEASVSPAQAQQVLDVLKDDKKRAAFTGTLEAIVHGLPAPAEPTEPVAEPAKEGLPLAPDSLGAELLELLSRWSEQTEQKTVAAFEALTSVPSLVLWVDTLATDPLMQQRLLNTAWRVAAMLASGLLAERAASWLLRRAREAVERRAPPLPDAPPDGENDDLARAEAGETEMGGWRQSTDLLLRRLPWALLAFMLDLIPVLAFAIVAHALVASPVGGLHLTQLTLLAVADGYVSCRVVLCLVRLLVAPHRPALRLARVDDAGAAAVVGLARWVVVLVVTGYLLAEVGLLFGLSAAAHDVLLKAVGLVVVLAVVLIMRRNRELGAAMIRARPEAAGFVARLRNRFAAVWMPLGGVYLLAMWFVWAVEIPHGFERLLRFAVLTGLVLLAARLIGILCEGALDHWAKQHPTAEGLQGRLSRHRIVLRGAIRLAVLGATIVLLAEVWGLDAFHWFRANGLGGRLASATLSVALVLAFALIVWEAANLAIDRHLARLTRQAQLARTARLRTLLPMLRSTLLIAILAFVALTVLSEIGVNIAPLLAGAGVIGIAIGFGSQKLVQDIINGLFLLMENAMQVGDTVSLAGLTGTVENLSVRTIRLRAVDGSVHIIPFSAVTTVTNMTRDYGFAVLDISIGLNEEPDQVVGILRGIAKEMRAEAKWGSAIRDDLEVMGVERFIDQAWVLRARIRTQPTQRWAVGREFNRRIKYKFDELAIESPITGQRVLTNPLPAPAKLVAAPVPYEGSPR